MTESDFNDCSALSLRLTNAIMSELELSSFGIDDISLFNVILKKVVAEKLSPENPNDHPHT